MNKAMTFYVYQLIDPRNGKPFYIGKGTGNRIDDHEREAKNDVTHPKCDAIRSIWLAGYEVKKEKIKTFISEDDAFSFEEKMIEKIGLDNLTNLTKGGRGAYFQKPSDPELKADKDKIKAFSLMYKKSNGFLPCKTTVFGFQFQLDVKFFDKIRSHIHSITIKRGMEWTHAEFKKYNVFINVDSKVDCYG